MILWVFIFGVELDDFSERLTFMLLSLQLFYLCLLKIVATCDFMKERLEKHVD